MPPQEDRSDPSGWALELDIKKSANALFSHEGHWKSDEEAVAAAEDRSDPSGWALELEIPSSQQNTFPSFEKEDAGPTASSNCIFLWESRELFKVRLSLFFKRIASFFRLISRVIE